MELLDPIDHVLVGRLFRAYEHFWYDRSNFKGVTIPMLSKYRPVAEHMDERLRSNPDKFRTKGIVDYDLGRLRYFVEILQAGGELDPIEVDNNCWGMNILPEPIVTDGHHRLVAYKLVKRRTIPAKYSGRLDVLAYLKGLVAKLPAC